MPQKIKKVSWKDFDEAARALAARIKVSGKHIIGITGVERGGLPLAVKLSNLLDLPYVRWPVYQVQPGVLIVDDVVDDGKTFAFLKRTCHPKTLFCSWFIKQNSQFLPDFYCAKVPADVWIAFPWEK